MAFDHIEPFRPWVDKLVIKLLSKIDKDMNLSEEDETGQIWLTLEYRKLLIHDFFTMMEERAYLNGKRIKRVDHIHYLSQRLATLLKNKEL